MKKLLTHLLLLLPALVWGQGSITLQPRSVSPNIGFQYIYPGKSPIGYDTVWNAAKIRDYVSTHSGGAYTFGSGLTNDGSGNISLGGTLTQDAFITGTFNILLGDVTGASYILMTPDSHTIAEHVNDPVNGGSAHLGLSPVGVSLYSQTADGRALSFNTDTLNGIVINDNVLHKGMKYGFRNWAPLGDSSLTPKSYVDSVAIAHSGANPDSTLHPNKNLNDIDNKATARLNLGVYSRVHIDSLGVINKSNSAKYWTKLAAGSSVIINQFGTSLTYGQNNPGGPVGPINGATQQRALYQAPAALQQTLLLAGISATVNNKGFPGDDIATGITRWDTCAPVDVAIIEYGTNDALNYGGHGVSPIDTFRNRYIRFIEKRINQGSWVFLTLPPDVTDETKNTLLGKYRSVISELSDLYHCPTINVQQINQWQNNFYFDEVHLSALGYNEWGVQEAAQLIKPVGSIPIVYNGQSFNPYATITQAPYTTNANATSGKAWSITASAYFPVVINMVGTGMFSTKGIQPSGTGTYYMQYGNALNQKIDTLVTTSTTPVYNRGGLIIPPGPRVLFIHGSGSVSYIDQINIEGRERFANNSKQIIGNYSAAGGGNLDKGVLVVQDTSKTTSGSYNAIYSKVVISPTASSTQQSVGMQVNFERNSTFSSTGGSGNNTIAAVYSNTLTGNQDLQRNFSSFQTNTSTGKTDNFYNFYTYSPSSGTNLGTRNSYGLFVEPQKTIKTSFGYGVVSRGTSDRSIIGGSLAVAGGAVGLDTGYVNANSYSILLGNKILPLTNGNIDIGLNTLAMGNIYGSIFLGLSSSDLKLSSQGANGISFYTGSTGVQVAKEFGATGNWLFQTNGTFTDNTQKLQVTGRARITQALVGSVGTDSIYVHDNTSKELKLISPTAFLSNPMTTLGDVIYGGASGAPTRLAGNTTTIQKFLTSTGNGSISAAPAYFDLFGNTNTWGGANNIFTNGARFNAQTDVYGSLTIRDDHSIGFYATSGGGTLTLSTAALTGTKGQTLPNASGIIGLSHSGSFSGAGTATTTFTVTTGVTEPNSTYRVNVTPTSALSAALFYINNKTTTTFDVVYLTGLTGSVTFDWTVFNN